MKKNFRLIAGIALLIQSVSMFVLFLTQLRRRRGLAAAFFCISAVGGLLGGRLLSDTDDGEEDGVEEADGDAEGHTDSDGNGVDDDLEIDDDMLKADLGHGTDDEEQGKE